MKTAVLWFRNDLRIGDNEALFRAANDFDRVIPVYVFDIDALHQKQYGSSKIGSRRVNFILESLADLKSNLQKLGGDLLVATGKSGQEIIKLIESYDADTVIAHKESTREEIDEEEMVKIAIAGKAELKMYWGHTLFHINDLPFKYIETPDVFTDFRKLCEKQARVREPFLEPEKLNVPNGFGSKIPSLRSLGFEERPISDKAAVSFEGGEKAAVDRLNKYFWKEKNLGEYKETRNGLLGENYSSKFSAWLARGSISARTIYWQVKKYEDEIEKNQSTYWLVFELLWRDYFRFIALKYGDQLFYETGIKHDVPDLHENSAHLTAWKNAMTGIPFVDANMKELNETGFMSNRGRQNVASFLVKDLKQDWRQGAAYFEEQLIDYDVSSNWGNWAYVSGVGNDPRENRYFNILTQAQRYDTKGEFVKHWLEELTEIPQEYIHKPWMLDEGIISKYGLDESSFARPVLVPDNWKL